MHTDNRIRRLRLSKNMLNRSCGLSLLCCCLLTGQPANERFEAAAIKSATPFSPQGHQANRRGGPGTRDPGMYTCRNCPIYWVLSEAYGLHAYDYVGPEWLHDTRFDFLAKVPPGATKDDLQKMLQNLLVERFKLAVHRATKQMSVYELTMAAGGPRFGEATPTDPVDEGANPGPLQRDADGFPILRPGTSMALAPAVAEFALRTSQYHGLWTSCLAN